NASTFGKRFSLPVDGYVYAQPLYMSNVATRSRTGRTLHYDLVFAATQHDSVYAFDADSGSKRPLWKTSFIDPAAGATTLSTTDVNTDDIMPEIGITGTPVIDPASGTLYVVAKTREVRHHNVKFVQRLHALNITTGAEQTRSPVVISATAPGTGDGADSNNQVAFQALIENQREA